MLRIRMHFSEYIEKFEHAFMTQKFETLTEAFHNVAKEFDVNPPGFVYDNLVGMWNKNTILSHAYEETESSLKDLKKEGYKLILIADTDNHSVSQVLDKFKLKEYFDEIILSCDVGHVKTEPEMFEIALEKTGLKKDEVVMVGDSIPTDIEGAKKAGIRPILVDRRDTREFEDKVLSLDQIRTRIE
jgi:HAD superfamily hydrolase (TIGR01549 family)